MLFEHQEQFTIGTFLIKITQFEKIRSKSKLFIHWETWKQDSAFKTRN